MGWTITGSGICANASDFTYDNPNSPSGTQVGFLQAWGTIAQQITVPSAGQVQVSFYAAQRGSISSPGAPVPNEQTFSVTLTPSGGSAITIGVFTPAGVSYERLTTEPVTLEAGGSYVLAFVALNPLATDNTAFLNLVTVQFVALGGTGGGDGASVDTGTDNPLRYLGYWQGETSDLGLTYVRQRWLDTGDGAWMSVDPVDGEPRYGYAHNAPTMRVDAQGTDDGYGMPGPDTSPDFDAMVAQWKDEFADRISDPQTWIDAAKDFVRPLRSLLHSYAREKKNAFAYSEVQVEHWAEGVPSGVAGTFSFIVSAISGLGVGFPMPSLSGSTLSSMDQWFGGQAGSAQRQGDPSVDNWMEALLPPKPGTKEDFQYRVGFLWGAFEMIFDQFDLIELASNILDVAIELVTHGDLWNILCEAASGFFGPLIHAGEAAGKRPFVRGKMAAKILITLVLLVILINGLLKALRKIPAVNRTATKIDARWQSAVKKTAAIGAPIEAVQSHLSSRRVRPDDIETKLKQQKEFQNLLMEPRLLIVCDLRTALEYELQRYYEALKSQRLRPPRLTGKASGSPETIGVAMSLKSQVVAIGRSGHNTPLGGYHPELRARIASATKLEGWALDNCAAIQAVDNLLKRILGLLTSV